MSGQMPLVLATVWVTVGQAGEEAVVRRGEEVVMGMVELAIGWVVKVWGREE